MGLRTIGVIAAMMLFATACERAFEDASGGIGHGSVGDPPVVAPVGPTDTAPDTGEGDGSGSAAPAPVATIPPPAGEVSPAPTVTLMYSERGRGGERGPLDGAAVDGPFDAHLTIDDPSIDPDRVTWLIDGDVFRDDDLDAPYTIRYNGRELPLDHAFVSDQGLEGRWRLDRGTSHEITAVITRPGDDLTISANFTVGDPGSDPSTGQPPPTTSAPAPSQPPSTTSTPPSTTSTPPATTVPPSDDGWPVLGPVAGRTTITGSGNWVVDYRDHGTPWHIHDVDIVADGGHAVGPPGAVGGGVMENASVVVDGGDNIKIATDGVYRNLYLRMATSGGHIDAMQSQGNSGWLIDNVVIEIPSPSPSVTGAIIIENLRGGGAGYGDVIGTINRLKLIGTGPWHHDIRLQNNPAATMTVTITNVDWSDAHPDSVLLLTGTPATLTVYVDDSVPDSRIKGAANATVIRI
jgi:hypothetical protein